MRSVDIFLVEDHDIVRQGLKALLNEEPGFKVVGEASNGEEALKLLQEVSPDLILMDMNMPVMNGAECTRAVKKLFPLVKVLILSMHDNESYLIDMLDAGADGYVLKNTTREELLFAIRKISNDGIYIAPEFTLEMLARYRMEQSHRVDSTASDFDLSDLEFDVLKLIADGALLMPKWPAWNLPAVGTEIQFKQTVMKTLLTLTVASVFALTGFAQTDSTVTTDTIPNLPVRTFTYKILLKQIYGEKIVYTVTSETISYEGSVTMNGKRKYFTVFSFFDNVTRRQYALIYNFRNKALYQTEWFDTVVSTDQLAELKVDFKHQRAKLSYYLDDGRRKLDYLKLNQIEMKETAQNISY